MILPANWPAHLNVQAGTTMRTNGFSSGRFASNNFSFNVGDAPALVQQNQEQWLAHFSQPVNYSPLQQVHRSKVIRLPCDEKLPSADACFTLDKNQLCSVMTADCLPILLSHEENLFAAAIHGGWRSLAQNIIEKTLNSIELALYKLQKTLQMSQVYAWLGPAISQKNFIVGEEVKAAFVILDTDNDEAFHPLDQGYYRADLYKIASIALAKKGVNLIYSHYHCTVEQQQKYYSYRRDRDTGRMISFIKMND